MSESNETVERQFWDDIKPEDTAAMADIIRSFAALRPEIREQVVMACRRLFMEPPEDPMDRVQRLASMLLPLALQMYTAATPRPAPAEPDWDGAA